VKYNGTGPVNDQSSYYCVRHNEESKDLLNYDENIATQYYEAP
jgi:hypothetical protein